MPGAPSTKNKGLTADWFVQGLLTKVGDAFDRFLGRGWKPSSSLATSELVSKLKRLLDSEVRNNGDGRLFVPHIIRLKMQWDKFSADSEESLRKLEHELLTAAVDHINDHRYYTFAPLQIDVKPDYFTSGVKLLVSFGADGDARDAEMNVTMPGRELPSSSKDEAILPGDFRVAFRFAAGGEFSQKELLFIEGERQSVGRTKENDLAVNDTSVSKFHASLLVNSDGQLVVADIGSTNGTFVKGERIAYGKAVTAGREGVLAFGTVEVQFAVHLLQPANVEPEDGSSEKFVVGDMEFSRKPATEPDSATAIGEKLPETE